MNTKVRSVAFTLGLLASGVLVSANAQGVDQASAQNNQTSSVREAVKQDLAAWRQAGFDESTYKALSQDVYGKEYQQRYAEYERLRDLQVKG